MKKLIDQGLDAHPAGDDGDDDGDKAPTAWTVVVLDDCDGCGDLRVEVTVEEAGRPGYGQVAHLSPEGARHLRGALDRALREIGAGD